MQRDTWGMHEKEKPCEVVPVECVRFSPILVFLKERIQLRDQVASESSKDY